MANGDGSYTVKELISEFREDIKGDIAELDKKVDSLDVKFDLSAAEHGKEHLQHERAHALEQVETVKARSDPAATPANRELSKQLTVLTEIVKTHENRWQRIIGVLLVLTFFGVSSLFAILILVWTVVSRLQPV